MAMMRIRFMALAALLLFVPACATTPQPAPASHAGTLRLMTYNIHAGRDAEQRHNLERVAALISAEASDIVLLQEVDRRTTRSEGEDHLAELARLTGMHSAFGRSLDFQGGEYGIAVLSRYPITQSTTVPLQVVPPQEGSGRLHEPRVGLHVIVQAPERALHIINTHVDHGAPPTYRHQEVIGLLAHVARAVPPDAPLLLGGDLNARPDTPEIAALSLVFRDAWTECGDGSPGYSFPAHAPDRRIDYLLLRGLACGEARVVETQASDHRPVVSTVRY
jgi:endonuclease/exonuclease/phosphatase family metal-dependent hydrolase